MSRRQLAALVAALLALLAIAFVAGRYSRPARVETRTVTETRVEYVDRWRTEVVTVQAKAEWRHRETTTVVEADGDVVTHEVEDEAADTQATTQAQAEGVSVAAAETKAETVKVETAARPDWRVSALAGLRFNGGLALGGEVSRRILGPVWLGAWGRTDSAGLSLGFEW